MSSVLIVDDERMVLDVLSAMLTSYGHEVTAVPTSFEAWELLDSHFDLYLFDLRMPEPSGADLAEEVRRRHADALVLIMTAFPGDPLAARALRSGVAALVRKPFEIGKIVSYLSSRRHAEVPNEY